MAKVESMMVEIGVSEGVLKQLLDKISNLECRVQQLEEQVASQGSSIVLNTTVLNESFREGGMIYNLINGVKDER